MRSIFINWNPDCLHHKALRKLGRVISSECDLCGIPSLHVVYNIDFFGLVIFLSRRNFLNVFLKKRDFEFSEIF